MEGRPRDESELVLGAQRGDARAFEELVCAHWEVLFRVAVLVSGDAAEAEDVVQDSAIRAFNSLKSLKGEEGKFGAP